LGKEWDLSPETEVMDTLEDFTSLLYGPKASSTKVNDLVLFLPKRGEISPAATMQGLLKLNKQLPTTKQKYGGV